MSVDVQNEKPAEKKENALAAGNCPGSRNKIVYRWKDGQRGSELVQVDEYDIQEKMNDRGRGRRPSEQIARILNGDTSVLMAGDGVTGDIAGNGERTTGELVAEALAPLHRATGQAQANGMNLSELERKVNELQAAINAQKNVQAADVDEKKE